MKKRAAEIRLAALFLFLAAAVWAASLWRERALTRSFPQRSAEHLARDVDSVRRDMAALETQLDATAARIVAQIGTNPNRARLFQILGNEVKERGRGARILDGEGNPVAWWGEDFRAPEQ